MGVWHTEQWKHLAVANVEQVTPDDYLNREFDVPVYCQIGPGALYQTEKWSEIQFQQFYQKSSGI